MFICAAAGSANTEVAMPSTATADFMCCSPWVRPTSRRWRVARGAIYQAACLNRVKAAKRVRFTTVTCERLSHRCRENYDPDPELRPEIPAAVHVDRRA